MAQEVNDSLPTSQKPSAPVTQKRSSKLNILWVLAFLIFVVVIGIVTVTLLHHASQVKVNGVTVIKATTENSPQISDNSLILEHKKDYAGAESYLLKEIATTSDKNVQSDIYMQLSGVSANFKDNKKAIEYAHRAETLAPSTATAFLLAKLYFQMGDKANAKNYAQKSLDRIPKNDPIYDFRLKSYQKDLSEELAG